MEPVPEAVHIEEQALVHTAELAVGVDHTVDIGAGLAAVQELEDQADGDNLHTDYPVGAVESSVVVDKMDMFVSAGLLALEAVVEDTLDIVGVEPQVFLLEGVVVVAHDLEAFLDDYTCLEVDVGVVVDQEEAYLAVEAFALEVPSDFAEEFLPGVFETAGAGLAVV